jgi:hypothetical protein
MPLIVIAAFLQGETSAHIAPDFRYSEGVIHQWKVIALSYEYYFGSLDTLKLVVYAFLAF